MIYIQLQIVISLDEVHVHLCLDHFKIIVGHIHFYFNEPRNMF